MDFHSASNATRTVRIVTMLGEVLAQLNQLQVGAIELQFCPVGADWQCHRGTVTVGNY